MTVDVRWLQGQVDYGFRLDIRRAAGPAAPNSGDRLTLTPLLALSRMAAFLVVMRRRR